MPETAPGEQRRAVEVDPLRARLRSAGQEHLLAFYDRLDGVAQRRLLEQLAALDLEAIPALVRRYVLSKAEVALPRDVQPAAYYPRDPGSARRPWDARHFRAEGERLLREGRVAAFTVAGGQGSRLGFEGP